jgi:hypothetical protein
MEKERREEGDVPLPLFNVNIKWTVIYVRERGASSQNLKCKSREKRRLVFMPENFM